VLKVQLTKETFQDFLRETRTLFRLQHPHIVPLLDFGIDGETPFLVVEYAPHRRWPMASSILALRIRNCMRSMSPVVVLAPRCGASPLVMRFAPR
jgi:hypothetical protein